MIDSRMSRRTMLFAAGSVSLVGIRPAQAQDAPDPTRLTWDADVARKLWGRASGPDFTIVDTISLEVSGKLKPAPARRLTQAEIREVTASLVAASKFYAGKGLDAPTIPLLDQSFVVVFLDKMGDSNGASGSAKGVADGAFASLIGITASPDGYYLMVNAENYFAPEPDHPWAARTTLAHELLHCIDATMLPNQDWLKGIGKWWSEGTVEATGQHAYRDVGYDPLTVLKGGARAHAKNVGMRPYDVPLTLKNVPNHRPAWVRHNAPIGPDEIDGADSFWESNATYFTSSFWRYLLKEEAPAARKSGPAQPGYFELLPALRRYRPTDEDRRRAEGNPYMDAGVTLIDRFLRKEHPVWKPTGLYRAFPAFVAHFVEWPDQIVKSRAGLFAHSKWTDVLFMKGAPLLPLSQDDPIEIDLEIEPLSARAIRFIVPMNIATGTYPAVTISVSAREKNGRKPAIDNVHVGLRGQCLANNSAQMSGSGRSRVRRWANIKATPLNRQATKGETILTLVNIGPDPVETETIRVRLSIAIQVAESDGQFSFHPEPVADENGDPVTIPASVAPKGPPSVPVVATTRGRSETKITLVKDADVVRMMSAMGDINTMMAIERVTDDPEPKPDTGAMAAKVSASMMAGTLRAVSIELTLPRIEPGFVGAVTGATLAAEWPEPAYARYARYGVSPGVRIETDAVQVQITGSTDGALLGTFSADFDRGSNNQNRIFRGRIDGRFSVGIAHDESEDEAEPPTDPTALLPTDFFVAAARSGMDSNKITEAMREALANTGNEPQSDPGGGQGSSGAGLAVSNGDPGQCDPAVTQADLELFLEQHIGSMPGITAGQIAEIRASMLADWESSKYVLCLWKQGLM